MDRRTLRLQLRRLKRSESGQALAFIAVGTTMLLMMAGLGVDVGYLHYQKQQMQKAADSAALAGAEALSYGSSYSNAGISDATANGFPNGQNGITVAVNSPPQIDPIFQGQTGYVEAIVTQARPTFFMKVAGFGSLTVSARAVAGVNANGSGCIYALDPGNDSKTLDLNGNVSVSSTCGVYVDSTSSQALRIDGSSGTLNAGNAGIGVVGPAGGGGWYPSAGTGFTPMPVNIPAFKDPLLSLAAPPANGPCVPPTQGKVNGGTTTLGPGTYCGGISISGGANVTFTKGLYVLCGGGMSVGGNSTINGSGVTFYNTGSVSGVCPGVGFAPVSIVGTSGSSLTAPTSGTYAGILFFQDRAYQSAKNVDASSINGTAGATFTGALYFPGTNLTYAGNPNANVSSIIVAWQITISGNATLNNNLLLGGNNLIQKVALAE